MYCKKPNLRYLEKQQAPRGPLDRNTFKSKVEVTSRSQSLLTWCTPQVPVFPQSVCLDPT